RHRAPCSACCRWATFLKSPGEATWSPVLARSRQLRANFLLISRCLSPGEAR
ncbi:hypothetical protein A2U01_0105978, partial [Trifolium medium]|nr:hypothetical protein [Trifolium medium]